MKRYFFPKNNIRNQLLKRIADAINEYYPTGVSSLDSQYHEYPGIIEAKKIINDNISPEDKKETSFTKSWSSLLRELNKKSSLNIDDTTFWFTPSRSADLILEHFEDDSLIRIKRIAFAVSMLGPFFTICGVDDTFIKEKEREFAAGYHAINVITASPYKEFENDFLRIKVLVEKYFPNYQFIPFEICMLFIKDTDTLDSMGAEGTIYSAFFNNRFNFYTHHRSRGDRGYGDVGEPDVKVVLSAPPKL